MADRLKIFVFTDNFAPLTETFVYDHTIRLAAQHEVQLACVKRMHAERFPFEQVHVLDYPESKIRKIIRSRMYRYNLRLNWYNPSFKLALSQLLTTFQPDVIHCHFGNKAILLLDNLDVEIYQGPIFITFYGYDASELLQKRPAYRRRIRQILQRRNVYPIMVSNHLLQNLSSFNIVSDRSQIIHLGTDTDFFKPWPKTPEEKFIFLQISGFREKKGHVFTLRAFAKFLQSFPEISCRLILAGSGHLEAALKKLVQTLGIAKQVEFSGWVNREEAKHLLNRADAFLHFSVTSPDGDQEGLPVAITEAMAMELPIGATYHSGIPEVVEDGVNGLLTREKDLYGYVAVLKGLTSWGRQPQNRQKIMTHFNQEHYIDQELVAAYRKAIEAITRQ